MNRGLARLDGPLAVVIGAEGPGVRQGVLAQCDFKVRVPMLGDVAFIRTKDKILLVRSPNMVVTGEISTN